MKTKTALCLTFTALAAGPASVLAAPANDAFSAAQVAALGATAGTTTDATAETGEPRSHLQNNFTSVWYTFTPATTGLYTAAVVGTDTTPVAHNVAIYTGSAVNALTRVSFGPDFQGIAGATYRVQVTGGTTAATRGAFSLTLAQDRPGTVVLPFFSNWEYLHPVAGEDPTTDANWATKWKIPGDTTAFNTSLSFSVPSPAPFGYETLTGAPGLATLIGTPTGTLASTNNAAYFRTSFILLQESSNLWAEVLADDGAYIYIDDKPGIPLRIAAKLSDASITTNTAFKDFRAQTDVHITGAVPTAAVAGGPPGCRAYGETGFNVETQTQKVFLSGLFGKLGVGAHTVAVSLHQTTSSSSDLAFDLQIVDYAARKLPTGGSLGITFTDTPYVASSATATVVPVAEHHHAPRAGQTDLAWFCVSPATRGATALQQGAVVTNTTIGTAQGKALRLNEAEAQAFVTEPIDIQGLPQFTASIKIRTNDSSSGFEAADGFRIFLETSADGINFSEPAAPLELQPQVNGAEALNVASTAWVTKSLFVTPSPGDKAVRLVMTGGTDSVNESIYLDDVVFATCLVTPTATVTSFNNQGDDDISNDTVTFDLSVVGVGTAATTFTTNGLGAGLEQTGNLNAGTISITRPVTVNATGVRQAVTFKVEETGNPSCFANVSITPPAAAITAGTLGAVTRSNGASSATADDDTFTFTASATADYASTGWKLMSSNTADTTVYASGAYGATVNVTVPATIRPTFVFVDNGDANTKRNATLNLSTTQVAIGKTILNGITSVVYADAPVAATNSATWLQASAVGPGDTEFTVDSTTIVLNNGNTANANGTVGSATGTIESPAINVAGLSSVQFKATLRAFEHSTSSGFEVGDVFKLEVDVTQPSGTSTVNLIEGNAVDINASKDMNGLTGTTADPYNSTPEKDEFNQALALIAANSRGTFTFTYNVPADATELKFRFIGTNNSTNEFYFVKEVVVADGAAPVDTDGDGLDDNWEISYFGDKSQGANDDPDADGSTNIEEYNAGTIPNDSASRLAIATATRDATNVALTWQSVPGKSYRIQKSTDLTTGSWTNVGALVPAAASPATTTSANAPHLGVTPLFFRVVIP